MPIRLDLSGPERPASIPSCAVLLHAPPILDPFLLHGNWPRRGTVQEDGISVVLDGRVGREAFRLESPLPAGSSVVVVLHRWFWACDAKALESFQIEMRTAQEAKRKADEQAHHERQCLIREEAKAFNATIQISAKWTAGYESVLSGLSERSNGDGCFARTVHHILLLEPLTNGRLKRLPNDFLCGYKGKQWTERGGYNQVDESGQPIIPKITCRTCLKVAERLANRQK